ncbi:MAG: Hsp20/alpha crystallin family protein [Anaerolineae bacterium]|nr:Hsp20/alpha crystallin family protein [Anaerolineae bacterium]
MNWLVPYNRMFSSMRRAMELSPDWDFMVPMEDNPLAINVSEDEDEVIVVTALPGVTEEDIDIQVNDNRLTISAEIKDEYEESEKEWQIKELRYGQLRRTVILPTEIDLENTDAEMENGLLTITLPKAESGPLQKIAVKAKELLGVEEA